MNTKKWTLPLAFCLLTTAAPLWAHCEIPCGIYGDQARFAAIEEDLTTIEKAMRQIGELSRPKRVSSQPEASRQHEEWASAPQNANQLARWVATKEEHANRIQHVVSQYFMTQRLKAVEAEAGDEAMAAYTNKLVLLHKMLRGAMQCKQTVDVRQVEKTRALLQEFKQAYQH